MLKFVFFGIVAIVRAGVPRLEQAEKSHLKLVIVGHVYEHGYPKGILQEVPTYVYFADEVLTSEH